MRNAAAAVALLASVSIAQAQAPPAQPVYRDAVATYIKTGVAERAVLPLIGLDRKSLESGVAATLDSGDAHLIEAAALLHLEIGVAVAGLSTASSSAHFEFGAQLVESLEPVNPDARRRLSAARAGEIAMIRATWFGVAGSAFLSVNDVYRARILIAKAHKILPRSPAMLTLMGIADEIDGSVYNPDDIESLIMKTRAARERNRLLLSAQQWYRQALSENPNYALAHIRLGRVEFLFRNMKAAEQSLQKGRENAEDPAHRYLAAMFTGAFLQEQKDLAGARAQFERALEIAPQSQSAMVALAYVQLISGRPDHAQALARGHLGTPNSDEGWWAFKNGTLDQAGLRWLRGQVLK